MGASGEFWEGEIRAQRELGVGKRDARYRAFVSAIRQADTEQREQGITYEPDEVRQAVVHTRQDVALVRLHLYDIEGDLRSIRRWVIAVVFLLAVLVLQASN